MTTPTAKDREAARDIVGECSYHIPCDTYGSASDENACPACQLGRSIANASAQARADERERVAKRMDMFAEIATDDRDGRLARTCYVFAAAQIRVLSDAEGDPE